MSLKSNWILLAGALALVGVANLSGQEKKAEPKAPVKPAPPVPAPPVLAPGEARADGQPVPPPSPPPDPDFGRRRRIAVAPAMLIAGANAVVGDDMVLQLEQQFGPQFRNLYRSELHFMRIVAEPTKPQFEKIAAAGDAVVKSAAGNFARAMAGNGMSDRSDPRKLMAEAIAKSVRATLSPEQAARYQQELDLRRAAKQRMAVDHLVSSIDRALVLAPEQREKLGEILRGHWTESWGETQMLMMSDHHFPPMPDAKIIPILSPAQQTTWRGLPKGNYRFVSSGAVDQAADIADEVWDENAAPKTGVKP